MFIRRLPSTENTALDLKLNGLYLDNKAIIDKIFNEERCREEYTNEACYFRFQVWLIAIGLSSFTDTGYFFKRLDELRDKFACYGINIDDFIVNPVPPPENKTFFIQLEDSNGFIIDEDGFYILLEDAGATGINVQDILDAGIVEVLLP